MLQRKIVRDVWRQHRWRFWSTLRCCADGTAGLVTLAHRFSALLGRRRLRTNRFALALEVFCRLLTGLLLHAGGFTRSLRTGRRCSRARRGARGCGLRLWPNVTALLVIPGVLGVGVPVETGKQSVFRKLESVFHDE